MRVAYDARYVRDSYGGIARYAFCLLSALVAEAPGMTFVVYHDPAAERSRFPLAPLLGQPNVEARASRLPLHSAIEQAAWPWRLWRDGVDLYYSPYFAWPVATRVPAVVTVHDTMFEELPEYRRGRWVRAYYFPMVRLATRRAAGLVTVSGFTRQGLVDHYGVNPDVVAVVPEAVADSFRSVPGRETREMVRARLGLPERFVLALGARRPHKNLGAAARAWSRLAELPHGLVVVGRSEPRYPDDVAAALESMEQRDRVMQLPTVSEPDLPAVYALADALVMPSLHEGFGLPALEAMACGTPVVAYAAAAIPEVVGDAALLVDPGDERGLAEALRRVLTDEALRSDLRQRGRRRAARFDWHASARVVLDLFDRLLVAKP